MSVMALVIQKAVFILRPLCLPIKLALVWLYSGLMVSFPEALDKAAIKNECGRVNINVFVFFLFNIHAKQND